MKSNEFSSEQVASSGESNTADRRKLCYPDTAQLMSFPGWPTVKTFPLRRRSVPPLAWSSKNKPASSVSTQTSPRLLDARLSFLITTKIMFKKIIKRERETGTRNAPRSIFGALSPAAILRPEEDRVR